MPLIPAPREAETDRYDREFEANLVYKASFTENLCLKKQNKAKKNRACAFPLMATFVPEKVVWVCLCVFLFVCGCCFFGFGSFKTRSYYMVLISLELTM